MTPLRVASALIACAVLMLLGGVYLLAGTGWCLVAGSVPLAAMGAVAYRADRAPAVPQ